MLLLTLFGLAQTASALTFGDFTYTQNGSSVTVTGYPTTGTGVITVPDTIDGMPVTEIGDRAFFNCSGLVGISIPASVTRIGDEAFYHCSGLTSMTLPSGVTVIPKSAFEGCTSLGGVSLTGNITSIGASAFNNCTSLTEFSLPSSVVSVGDFAFLKCANLETLSLSAALESIGVSAFADCTKLAAADLSGTALTSMGVSAFSKCNALTSVTVPSTLAGIPSLAFDACASLATVTIPEGVVSLGSGAFRLCPLLTSIHLPASLTTVDCNATNNGGQPFNRCISLTGISVSAGNTAFVSVGGVLFNAAKTQLFAYPTGLNETTYAIPGTVQTIKHSALRGGKFTAVTIPSSVNSIENSAFSSCSQLVSATFEGNAPANFGSNVFNSAAASGFKVYFYAGAANFATPKWPAPNGYDSEEIGSLSPVASWLQAHGLPSNSSLSSDSNGDGVNLLMAYALNLDPAQNLSASLPQTVITSGYLSMSFYGAAQGVTYSVQVSSDLVSWSSNGVVMSAPDSNQMRTATCDRSGSQQFMRLVVSY